MAEADYRKIADGGELKRLVSGLQIIRRRKHEWLASLQTASPEELRLQTNKIRGSKFLAAWTLTRYVEWIEAEVAAIEWDFATAAAEHTVRFAETVGYSKGKPVTRIRIVLSSRCIHAYPVED
jgi:hypothetical protein